MEVPTGRRQKGLQAFLDSYLDSMLTYGQGVGEMVLSGDGREIEALLGSSARWNSANVEAFCNMPWPQEDLAVIQEMWPFYREVPVVLGGYFTGRHLNNAWNNVVIGGEPLRDSLEEAVKEINRELSMKQREYGVT